MTAGAQLLAGLVAVALVQDYRGFLVGAGLFTALWLSSAWLFAKAERDSSV